ncbi:hypothetical protein [Pseudoramibacter alactolyticus]|jgi:hypothetical protein|uniref:hypothetical protein n=1 Tax=Pseudoramibacter alactolyticus TaxID=113287 RepID=UPI00235381A5|nr:hypothetical protein [Pseudoramibacter alactolyticus]MBM6969233.1 hypothetical protein [Pseudoramibacter alactolyticus]
MDEVTFRRLMRESGIPQAETERTIRMVEAVRAGDPAADLHIPIDYTRVFEGMCVTREKRG